MAEELSNVIYIAHLPDDFEEPQMKKFFSQFGEVKNVQLSRQSASGNSRHYGFVQFETPEIAKITADAVNGYIIDTNKRPLQCSVRPKSQVHDMLFKNARTGPKKPKEEKVFTKKEIALKMAKAEQKLRRKLDEKGIDYTWPTISEQLEAKGISIQESK